MKIKDLRNIFLESLCKKNDSLENESIFYIVLENLHNLKRVDLALNPSLEISESEAKRWYEIIEQLQEEKPIQYILGETEFFGLPFVINENTLIPRPETEELVEFIISEIKKNALKNLKIIDIGTGSGCIAISLSKNCTDCEIFALDVSEKALEIAKLNAIKNGVEVQFVYANILELENLSDKFDIIVSNPPYVRNLEKAEIKPNVLQYEPHLALFVDDLDALLFYRKIGEIAQKNLVQNGCLFFEINQYLGQETLKLVQDLGFKNSELRKDIYGNDRMIKCQK